MDTNLSIGLMAVLYGVKDHLLKSKTPSLLMPLFEQAIEMVQTISYKADECWSLTEENRNLRQSIETTQRFHDEKTERAHKAAKFFSRQIPRKAFADLVSDALSKLDTDPAFFTGQHLVDIAHLDQLDRAQEMFLAGNAIETIKGLRGAFMWDLRKAKLTYEKMVDLI